MIINASQINLRDERRYQDNREYSQMDIKDSKNITPTRVKVKQTNLLGKHYNTVQFFLVKFLLCFFMVSHCFSFSLSLPYFY